MRILVIEDDVDVAENVCTYFERRGHSVDIALDGLMGLRLAQETELDVVVLDLSLPRLDGVEVCRQLRETGNAPGVLMLTARDAIGDKLAGFEAGADDYVVKPFSLAELEARLHALSQRTVRWGARTLRFGTLSLNRDTREVHRGTRKIMTTRVGRRILELLMRNAHRVVTRGEIEEMLWADDPPESDALRTHIHALRRAIDLEGPPSTIETITGEGYRLVNHNA